MNKRKYQKPSMCTIACYKALILSGSIKPNGPGGAKQQPFGSNNWDETSENTENNLWSKDENK